MITKVYIDNFRCFTNFELELGPFHLLLGENGSGKSSLFDALVRIQRLLLGVTTRHLFRSVDLTGWDNRTTQEFAVEMRVGEDQFRYELRVEHEAGRGMEHIAKERLFWFSSPVYAFESGHAQLYSVSPSGTAVDASFPFDPGRSYISFLPERPGNQPLERFRQAVCQWFHLGLSPGRMDAYSRDESTGMARDGSDFISWYMYLATARPEAVARVSESLQEVIPGIEHLHLETIGEAKWLEARFKGLKRALPLFQLSDGQRALIVLYTILKAAPALAYSLFMIDEPDNYVSLREIQPWLTELEDLCREGNRQALLISHHPELINRLAKDYGLLFTRPDGGPVRVTKGYPVVDGLTAAETMARGWGDE